MDRGETISAPVGYERFAKGALDVGLAVGLGLGRIRKPRF
jgi:hypothetical protein